MELIIVKAAPPGVYIVFAVALYVWHVAASLLGVTIADRFGFSTGVSDWPSDLKKMSLCSLIALSVFFPLFYIAQSPAVFVAYLLIFLFSLKIAYLEASPGFPIVILSAVMVGMIAFVPIVSQLRLPGIFILYLVFLVAYLVLRQKRKKQARDIKKIERLKEQQLRNQVRRDPNFTTFCYQCLFYSRDSKRCQLQIDGQEIHHITLKQRTYCTSFRPDRAMDLPARKESPAQ